MKTFRTHLLALLIFMLLAASAAPSRSFAAELTGSQQLAEQDAKRISELSLRNYRKQRYVEESSADAFAVRALERAYGPLHSRVIEHLAGLLIKHSGHGAHSSSAALGDMMIEKLDALPGTPVKSLPGYNALVIYFRCVADNLREESRPFLKRTLLFLDARLGSDHADVRALREYLFGAKLVKKPFEQAFEEFDRILKNKPNFAGELFKDNEEGAQSVQSQEVFLRAIAYWREAFGDDHFSVASVQSNRAADLLAQSRIVEAMPIAAQAVASYEKSRLVNPGLFAMALLTLSAASAAVGATDQAERLTQRAAALLQPFPGEPWQQQLTLYSAAYYSLALFSQGRREEALAVANTVIAGFKGVSGTTAQVSTRLARNVRAGALMALKRPGEAFDEINALINRKEPTSVAGRLYREHTRHHEQMMLADAEIALGRIDDAIRTLALAEARVKLDNDFELGWLMLLKAKIAAQTGRKDAAILLGKMAVNRLQGLRRNVKALDAGFERGFVLNNADTYQFVADLLIDAGRLPEAQDVLAMLKESEYADFVSRAQAVGATEPVKFNGRETAWEGRSQHANEKIAALGRELDVLRGKSGKGETLSPDEAARREALDGEMKTARAGFEKYLADMMREFSQGEAERGIELGEKNLSTIRALQGTLKRLGQGTVLLHYLVTDKKLRIILTTPSVQIARESTVDAKELARKVQAFRRATMPPLRNAKPIAGELYQLLIGPVQADLDQAAATTLMVSLDGVLRYLPVAALHDGERYLIERYRVAMYNEAARDKLKDMPQVDWRIAGLGLTRELPGFVALPAVKEELEGIIRSGVLPGEVYLDNAFDGARLRLALDQGFPVVHVASHFVFQTGTDVDSYLLLGDGTKLSLRDIKEGNLSFADVDLFTLSACDTANFGGRDANGREVEGLGTLLQKQGARSVIATLWPVADESTGLFMQQLYRSRQTGKLNKAEALRQTQLGFLSAKTKSGDKLQDFSHPFYWAPFILMGNWL